MSKFTTRVELHHATKTDYEVLHSAMDDQNFERTITSSDGDEYHLPMAEYNFEGSATAEVVLDKAEIAAARTGKKASIIVSEAVRRRWSGLPKA
jgi:hypothetical protein